MPALIFSKCLDLRRNAYSRTASWALTPWLLISGQRTGWPPWVPDYLPVSMAVTPSHPTKSFAFLQQNGLIGTNRLETIANLLSWGHKLDHNMWSPTAANTDANWQYRGYAPVSRTIDGTLAKIPNPTPGNWTMGCWGTMGFLKAVLLSVNIPVKITAINGFGCNHATPYFPSEGLYLSHGDDPYSFFQEGSTTVFPVPGDILIDQATYTSWFTGDPSYVCGNIGRRPAELALDLLPDFLVQYYCWDISLNKSHAEGKVYDAFKHHFSLQYLENTNLWGRLSQRATDLGLWCGGM